MTAAPRYDVSLTGPQIAALIVLCLAATAALLKQAAQQRQWFDAAAPVLVDRVAAATEKIDPNTATPASLQRLGGIGPIKARAIADHARAQEARAFKSPEDLQAVRGIGEVIAQRMAPHLTFPPPVD